ncbi:hypothetical protein FIBSPDRAFT_563142 [Athelia psychrophila]|uniref:Uncharacterized protein n=1 Tax=Athelia psychrophila TaxID=1759441 RepID=A0A166I449_9AGAM|nr:hypothetical protein FIBSPDRAFT_563142 [Fibularhizoctonia sp. CBS 109695]
MSLLLAALLAIQCLSPAVAQYTTVNCTVVKPWENNKEGQSPCYMFSAALVPCQGFIMTILPLPTGVHYAGPTAENQNVCQCSTVTYSLMAACEYCQNLTSGWNAWSTWSSNCARGTYRNYPMPIPDDTGFPSWAYLDVTVAGTFDPGQAAAATGIESTVPSPASFTLPYGDAPPRRIIKDSKKKKSPVSSSSASSSSAIGSSSTSPLNASGTSSPGAGASAGASASASAGATSSTGSSSASTPISFQAPPASKKSDAGMIAGVVVGALAAAALLAGLVIFLFIAIAGRSGTTFARFRPTMRSRDPDRAPTWTTFHHT